MQSVFAQGLAESALLLLMFWVARVWMMAAQNVPYETDPEPNVQTLSFSHTAEVGLLLQGLSCHFLLEGPLLGRLSMQ